MENIASLIPLLLIVAFFWLFILRPARNRQRDTARTQSTLVPGAKVMTGGGLFATVHALEDDKVVLETSPGVLMTYARGAVAKVISDEVPDLDADSASPVAAATDTSLSTGTPIEGRRVDGESDPATVEPSADARDK